jgi:Flp pilus assembly pilin Flp
MIRSRQKNTQGSGIVEYVLITALVAVVTIAVFKTFRSDVTEAYKKAGQALVAGVQETSSSSSSEGE